MNHRRNSFDDITRLFDLPPSLMINNNHNGTTDHHQHHPLHYSHNQINNGFCGVNNNGGSPLLSLSLDNLLNDDYLNLSNITPTIPSATTTCQQATVTNVQTQNVNIINNNANTTTEPHLHLSSSNHHHHNHHHNHAKSAFHSFNPQHLTPFIPQQMSISPCTNGFNLLTPTNTTNITMKSFFETDRDGLMTTNSGISRSNSQPDLTAVEKTPTQLGLNKIKTRRHPSFSCKTSMSECSEELYVDFNEINTTTTTDDGIFLGTDAISDFLSGGSFSDILDDLPDLEGLMSVVTFDSNTSWPKQTQCDINLDDHVSTKSNVSSLTNELANESRISRSAPPSPTPIRSTNANTKKRNLPWHKAWSKMSNEEQVNIVDTLTRVINDEMGLREQLEIIRILNPDAKLLPTDTQFVIDLSMIDDEKFRRLKEIIKFHGLKLNENDNNDKNNTNRQISDNCSECSAKSCPQGNKLIKRELRLRRAQQRLLKHAQRKETRQILKESKSGLFIKTEVIPLSQVLPEEDVEIDILS